MEKKIEDALKKIIINKIEKYLMEIRDCVEIKYMEVVLTSDDLGELRFVVTANVFDGIVQVSGGVNIDGEIFIHSFKHVLCDELVLID